MYAGQDEHGDDLVGDPLGHLEEELLDALAYCYWAKRQRRYLRSVIAVFKAQKAKEEYYGKGQAQAA